MRRRAPSSMPRRGFTLIETLMALMIFATVLVGYIAIMGQSSRIEGDLIQRHMAAMLAQNLIEEIRLTPSFETGELQGEFPGDYEGYRWTSNIEEHEEIPSLYVVEVRVTWNENENYVDDYTLKTLMAKFSAGEQSDTEADVNTEANADTQR